MSLVGWHHTIAENLALYVVLCMITRGGKLTVENNSSNEIKYKFICLYYPTNIINFLAHFQCHPSYPH